MWNFSTSIKISPLSHQVFVYSFLQVQTFLSWWQYDCIHHQEIWIFLFLLQHWQGRMKRTPTTNISKHALCLMLVMFVTLIFFITIFTTCNHVILSQGKDCTSSLFQAQPLTELWTCDHQGNIPCRRIVWAIRWIRVLRRAQTPGQGQKETHAAPRVNDGVSNTSCKMRTWPGQWRWATLWEILGSTGH